MKKSANTVFRFFFSILDGLRDPEFRGLLFFVLIILTSGTVFYIFSGVGVILGFLNVVAKHANDRQLELKKTIVKYTLGLDRKKK